MERLQFKSWKICRKLIAVLFISLLSIPVTAQDENDKIPSEDKRKSALNNPYQSVYNHLNNLQPGSYNLDQAARSFENYTQDAEKAKDAAIKLKQIWDARGYFVEMDQISGNPDYTDSITDENIYTPVVQTPGIYLEKQPDQTWKYSMHSIGIIHEAYEDVFPFGSEWFINMFPHKANIQIFGLYLWQHVGIIIIILLAFLLHKLLTLLFNQVIFRGAYKLGYDNLVKPFVKPVSKPLSLFMVFLLVMALYPLLQLPVKVSFYLNYGFKAILPFFATLVFYKLVDFFGLYLERMAKKTETNLDDHIVPIVRKTLRVFVVVIGGLFILQNLDVNITALLAGLSIGGLALALAAQDTLKNLFGSFMIFIDRPFMVGHWITSSELDGTVEDVGFRSTRIRTFRNSLVYVPNGKLADSVIDNHGLRKYRRFFIYIGITYDTPPDLIQVFVEGLRRIVQEHPRTRKDYYNIEFNDMGDFSLKIMFYIFFAVPTWPEELRARHEVLLEIVRLADNLGVRFAFPTQTLHMETFPDKSELTPKYDMSMEEFRKVLDDYFAGKKK